MRLFLGDKIYLSTSDCISWQHRCHARFNSIPMGNFQALVVTTSNATTDPTKAFDQGRVRQGHYLHFLILLMKDNQHGE